MRARKAALLAMAKMALVDGTVSDAERSMLQPLLGDGEDLDTLLTEAKALKLEAIVGELDRYADRFFVALRACCMAHVDQHLDAREEVLIEELTKLLAITPSDRALIDESVAALDEVSPPPLNPRIEQLFEQSSFAPGA